MRNRPLTILALTACALVLAACSSDDSGETVTISHAAVTPVGVVPGAEDGVGTLRLFHADATFEGIGSGSWEATMVTTSVDTAAGAETRVTKIVFVLEETGDQLILEGSSTYPAAGSTIAVSNTVTRSIIGGSGRWAGAQGSAVTTHLDDGSWTHVFNLLP